MNEGEYFGELSLIYGAPRAATIKAVEATDLIVISKKVYDRIIKKFQVDQIVDIIDFYSNLVVFQRIPRDVLINLATKTQVVKIKRNEVFVKEGEITNLIWFIYIGKVNVVKKMRIKGKEKVLKIDTLSSTDIFGHHRIASDWTYDFSIITQLPWEFFGITKSNFFNLSKDIQKSFLEYAKPYPDNTVIKEEYYSNKRWGRFKEQWRQNITIDKNNQKELATTFKTMRGEAISFSNPFSYLSDQKKIWVNKVNLVNRIYEEDLFSGNESQKLSIYRHWSVGEKEKISLISSKMSVIEEGSGEVTVTWRPKK